MVSLLFGLIVGFSRGLTAGSGSIFAVPLLVYGLGLGHTVRRRAVLEDQVDLPPQKTALALMSLMVILATFALVIP